MISFPHSDSLYSSVVEILAVTVLLDMKQRDRELIEFTHAGVVHNQYLRPEKIVTRTQLLNWFHTNADEIKDKLTAKDALAYKTKLLSRITDAELQKRVLASIFTIAVCDYDLHDEESYFIKVALDVWNTVMPTANCLEAVA